MKKVHHFIIGLFIVIMGLSSSCVDDFKFGDDFLEKAPGVDVTKDTVFSNAYYARGFLWNAYTNLYYGLNWDWSARGNRVYMGMVDALTDLYHSALTWDGVNNQYYSGAFDATKDQNASVYSFTDGETQWTAIRKAYVFIENIDRTPDMSDTEKIRLKAEAKMIIACLYTDMFRHFGGLPLVKKAFDVNHVDEMYVPRSSVKETVQFITDLCDSAYVVLPWVLPAEEVQNWDGRFTGAAALGLKIRVLLHAASPLFNDSEPFYPGATGPEIWIGSKDPKMWQDVVDACDEFMRRNVQEGNPVFLARGSDPRMAYQNSYFVRNNGELLITPRLRAKVSWMWDQAWYYLESIGQYGSMVPTLEYANMFPNLDGTPFDTGFWDEQDSTKYTTVDPFANRDPRLYENCVVNLEKSINTAKGGAQLWLDGDERGVNRAQTGAYFTGFGCYKFVLNRSSMYGKDAQWPYLRYAEILLSYAEALNEVGRTGDAYRYINEVRARVGVGPLPSMPSQEAMREQILCERACEFGGEEVRYFDLVRWKRADKFRQQNHGINIRCKRDENNNWILGNFSYEVFPISARYIQDQNKDRKTWTPKWFLTPIPFSEVMKGYLTQNPGW